MALQCAVNIRGGITHVNAYVRVKAVTVFKESGTWKGVVEWEVFKDGMEAGKSIRVSLSTPDIDRDKFAFDLAAPNPIAQAYTWAKANKAQFSGATDV